MSYGHTTVKAPYPIRTAQLSTVGPDQYYGRGLRGNLRCCMSFFIFTCKKKFAKEKKPISTTDSHVVPYRSTDVAQWCLTSQFRWDTVLSLWYDRMTRSQRPRTTRNRKKKLVQKKSRKKEIVSFFSFSRPRALWAFYFIIHIKHRNQRGDCYLNSIRKS